MTLSNTIGARSMIAQSFSIQPMAHPDTQEADIVVRVGQAVQRFTVATGGLYGPALKRRVYAFLHAHYKGVRCSVTCALRLRTRMEPPSIFNRYL